MLILLKNYSLYENWFFSNRMYLNWKSFLSYISKYGFQFLKHITKNLKTFQYFQSIDLKDNRLENCNFQKKTVENLFNQLKTFLINLKTI